MGHYAQVDENDIVVNVIVADQEFIDSLPNKDQFIKTSYNTRGGVHYITDTDTPSPDQSKALRKNFAGIGHTYRRDLDMFVPPKPFPSWVLDFETGTWKSPVPKVPGKESLPQYWSESNQEWILINNE